VADLVLSIAARHGVPTAATQEPGPSPPQGPEGPERRPPGPQLLLSADQRVDFASRGEPYMGQRFLGAPVRELGC
jgi:hypothetical protein